MPKGLRKNLGIPPYGKKPPKSHIASNKFKKDAMQKREVKFDKSLSKGLK